MSNRRLYIDTETTAGDNNELVEISCLYTVDFIPIETYTARIQHTEPITPKGYTIHGIADFMCNTPVFEMLQKIYPLFTVTDVICGHNVEFDIDVLRKINDDYLTSLISSKEIFCTMQNYRETWKIIFSGRTKASKSLKTSFSSLSDCESYLINNCGYDDRKLEEEFQKIFKGMDATHHSSPYDTFLCYLFDKVMHARKV